MARVAINTGATANDGTGDTLRAAGGVINNNFLEVYTYLGAGSTTTLSAPVWSTTNAGINTLRNVGIGTTNPRFTLEVGAVGSSGTSLYVNGDARITGILTIGTSSITLNGATNIINVGTGITIDGSTGIISATSFVGSGASLTGIIALGSGVQVRANGSIVGTATTIDFGANLSVSPVSAGIVTVTASSQFVTTAAGIHTLSNVGIGTTNPTSKLTVTGDGTFTGVVTATTFIGALTGTATTATLATNAQGLTGTPNVTVGTIDATSLNVSGVSTFAGITTVTGDTLFAKQLNVSGVSTFAGITTVTGTTLFAKQLNVSGVSTFAGITTVTGTTLFAKQLNVSGVSTARQFSDYRALVGAVSSAIETFVVTVAIKTTNHRYFGTGSASGYLIDGRESPFITLLPGKTYRFDQADASNATHQIRFYLEADKTTQHTTNVTFNGTAGSAGAYTEITVTDTTPIVLHYQCVNHGYMGNSVQTNSNFINTPYSINTLGGLSVSGVSTFAGITTVTGETLFSKQLNVSGVSTLGNILISSGIITTTASSFELYKPVLFNYSEKINTVGNTGATSNINLANGTYVTATLNQSTIFTFTTGITTGAIGFALQLTNGTGGPYSITWPASVYWPNNATPTRTTTDSKTDIWVFNSTDNGTKWYGNLALYNFS